MIERYIDGGRDRAREREKREGGGERKSSRVHVEAEVEWIFVWLGSQSSLLTFYGFTAQARDFPGVYAGFDSRISFLLLPVRIYRFHYLATLHATADSNVSVRPEGVN